MGKKKSAADSQATPSRLSEKDFDDKRIRCRFFHDGPQKLRINPCVHSCPACGQRVTGRGIKDSDKDARVVVQYRAAHLRQLQYCEDLSCMREFFEYIVALSDCRTAWSN